MSSQSRGFLRILFLIIVTLGCLFLFKNSHSGPNYGTIHDSLAFTLKSTNFDLEFPKHIWQTSSNKTKTDSADYTATWETKNPNWSYNWLSDDGATKFVEKNFQDYPAILRFWEDLQVIILRADFLRYLTMLAQGGVYSDIDTSNLVPIDEWIPENLRHENINAIVGIEYDDTTYKVFGRNISFCQWSLMAKPGHALFKTAVSRVMSNLEYVARMKRVSLKDLHLEKGEVLQATGPGMYTDVVIEVLRNQVGQDLSLEHFSGQKEPKVYGDVLVLPVRGFASGQKHSHANDPDYGTAFVKHHFGKSWYA